jgi:hypothetical protein
MELLNATGMQAGYTMGMDPSGREHLVAVVKGTFNIPEPDGEPRLAEAQLPLIEADSFTGEPGHSAPLFETDYPLRKPRCDVLLVGSAHAPNGRPVKQVQVGLQVGAMVKTFRVLGDRFWQANSIDDIWLTDSVPFEVMPITYDRAYGGVDDFHVDASKHTAYMRNPIGRGYHKRLERPLVHDKPAPNTEELNRPIKRPDQPYEPMAFTPVGRGWEPRLRYAGTYDQHWLDDVFPFLPPDFQDDYFQAAPADQQIPHARGGEPVKMLNLTPGMRERFDLPRVEVPFTFFRKKGGKEERQGVIDTIVFIPDRQVFTMTWRASIPLKKNMFEIPQVLAGRMTRAWWRARELGKTYYRSLDVAYREKRAPEEEEETEA